MAWVKLNLAEQLKYANSKDPIERLQFSLYPVLPEVADYMVFNEKDKSIMPSVFSNLFRGMNNDIRPSTLAKAAKKKVEVCGVSEFDTALAAIALHLNTDVDTLRYLFELNNSQINWGLAENPNTPKEILNKLSDIGKHDIDLALIHNPNTPDETRQKLLERLPSFCFSAESYYALHGIEVEASGN